MGAVFPALTLVARAAGALPNGGMGSVARLVYEASGISLRDVVRAGQQGGCGDADREDRLERQLTLFVVISVVLAVCTFVLVLALILGWCQPVDNLKGAAVNLPVAAPQQVAPRPGAEPAGAPPPSPRVTTSRAGARPMSIGGTSAQSAAGSQPGFHGAEK